MGWASAMPVFLSLYPSGTVAEKRNMALIAVPTSVVVLFAFAFLGDDILTFFGITTPAFRVAGGLVLLWIAFGMLTADPSASAEMDDDRSWVSLAVVPLAIPSLAGPGAITTVVIYSQIHEGLSHTLLVGLVILGAGLIILGMLWFASWLSKIMGITGIVIITRIMGLIVASIAVEFIMDGVALHFPELFGFEGHDE